MVRRYTRAYTHFVSSKKKNQTNGQGEVMENVEVKSLAKQPVSGVLLNGYEDRPFYCGILIGESLNH